MPVAPYLVAVRLFHELGHTNPVPILQYAEEEKKLVRYDAQLYNLIKTNYDFVDTLYPVSYIPVILAYNTASENNSHSDKVMNLGALITTYGKDFSVIAEYYGGDLQKTHEALLNWQEEFRRVLGEERTLAQLSTFKDSQHEYGTEYIW